MEKKLNKIVKKTNDYLYRYFSKEKNTDLIKPMLYGLLPGGKKIRSKILFDVGSIFKINKKTILQVAAAVECIHAYSLIHDDLPCMDNDNLRRGKLTTHKKFSESTAILAGNSLLTIAFQILSQKKLNLSEKKKIKLINLLSESSGHSGIAGGQYLDLSYEKIKKRFPPSKNVISLAWSDKVSFEEILMKTGKSENEVIKIMRKELTPNSFKSWRKRVSGRKAKHRKLNELKDDYSFL